MSPEGGFLQAIVADPDDDTPRLVYADWLEDHGQPERAEFIRAQIELARLGEGDPRRDALEARAGELEKAHSARWLQPLRQALDRPRAKQLDRGKFRRGFLHSLDLTTRRPDFLSATGDVLATQPVERLYLTGGSSKGGIKEALVDLSGTPRLPCLHSLNVCGTGTPTA